MPILDDGVVAGPGPLIPAPIYLTVYDADSYFESRLNSDIWFNASPRQKWAALVTATRAIDLLNFVGVKAECDQLLQFPRRLPYTYPTRQPVVPTCCPPLSVPTEILVACCEEALIRLDGLDIELEIDGVGVVTTTYAGVRESYDRTTISEGIRAGIGSNVAWNFLVPWLADGQSINLSRV